MAKILTDRTSVRVTAKSETDANNQKKNDANNIAKALGKDGDLDDTKASSVASKLGNTITDENGTTWAKSSEVAAAAKELDGEIEEKTEYDGITENGIVYKLNPVYSGGYNGKQYWDEENTKLWIDRNLSSNALFVITGGRSVFFSKESFVVNNEQTAYNLSMYDNPPSGNPFTSSFQINSRAANATINDVNYSFFIINDNFETTYGHGGNNVYTIDASYKTEEHGYSSTSGDLFKCIAGTLFGPSHKSGGSKVDTSKSPDQIKDELESKAWKQGKAAKINPIEPNETYIAVTDANGNPLYFLGT